ncbi:MAG: SAM-dependent methyltransferase [Microbacteriaceae bacterium]
MTDSAGKKLVKKILGRISGKPAPVTAPEYWDAKYSTDDFIYTKTANRFIVEFCEGLKPGAAIDLAGGEGRNTIWLAELGWMVENVDISSIGLKKCQGFARERGVSDRVRTLCASGANFSSTLAPVDLGIVPYLQVPGELLAASLKNLVSQIKSGGRIVGVWHALENLEGGFGGPQDPQVLPSVESMTRLLATLNLDVEVCELRDGQVQTKDGLKPSITLVVNAVVR